MKRQFLSLALRNILKYWRKSLITGTCITLGFVGVVLLGGYIIYMENYLTTQGIYLNHVGHLTVYKKNGLENHLVEPQKHSFSPAEVEALRGVLERRSGVERIAEFIHGQGLITNGCKSFPFLVWASEPAVESYLRNHPLVLERNPLLTKLKKGSGFWHAGNDSGVIITQRLAELLKKPVVQGDPQEKIQNRDVIDLDCKSEKNEILSSHSGVQLLSQTFEEGLATGETQVVGHFSTGFALSEDSSMLMPLEFAKSFFMTDRVTSLGIFLTDAGRTNEFIDVVKAEARRLGIDVEVYGYKDVKVNPFYVGSQEFLYVMNLFFLVIVCGVVSLSLVNAIQIAILERKAEIGTFLSIGYRRSHVRNIFEWESLLICGLSLVTGLGLSYLVVAVVNSLGITYENVGSAERILLALEVYWWFCLLLVVFFFAFVYAATSYICRIYLNVPVLKLLERAD